jgi:hypothetical protein
MMMTTVTNGMGYPPIEVLKPKRWPGVLDIRKKADRLVADHEPV